MKIGGRASLRPVVAATIPKELFEPTLSDLRAGQSAFIVPWAIVIDIDRSAWVNPYITPITPEKYETSELQVDKIDENKFVVHLDNLYYRFQMPAKPIPQDEKKLLIRVLTYV